MQAFFVPSGEQCDGSFLHACTCCGTLHTLTWALCSHHRRRSSGLSFSLIFLPFYYYSFFFSHNFLLQVWGSSFCLCRSCDGALGLERPWPPLSHLSHLLHLHHLLHFRLTRVLRSQVQTSNSESSHLSLPDPGRVHCQVCFRLLLATSLRRHMKSVHKSSS